MAAESFPQFAKLAAEIQKLIWEAAVREKTTPKRGHAHRFIMMDHYQNTANARAETPGDFVQFGPEGSPFGGWQLAVPHDGPLGESNDSIYATDNALWDTCRESRAAVERRFDTNVWWSQLGYPAHPSYLPTSRQTRSLFDVTHTASYLDRQEYVKHITINPLNDLVYLDPRGMNDVWWFHHYAGDTVPLLHDGNDHTTASFLGTNFAVDYDPAMLEVLRERPVHYHRKDIGMSSTLLLDMVVIFCNNDSRKLWFVDHRLQPLSSSSNVEVTIPDNRRTFCSDEALFIEVEPADMGTIWRLAKADDDDTTHVDSPSVFEFFTTLTLTPPQYFDDADTKQWGVLARLPRPGRTLPLWQPFSIPCVGAECPTCGMRTAKVESGRPNTRHHANVAGEDDDAIDLENWQLFDEDDQQI